MTSLRQAGSEKESSCKATSSPMQRKSNPLRVPLMSDILQKHGINQLNIVK